MVMTPSTMLPIGTRAPAFRLPDTAGGGRPVPQEQTPSIGCNIKWKAGNAPDYFGG